MVSGRRHATATSTASTSRSAKHFLASTTTSAQQSLAASALPSTPWATSASQPALASWRAATTGLEPDHGLHVEHILLASSSDLDEMHRLGVTGVIPTRVRHGNGRPGPRPRATTSAPGCRSRTSRVVASRSPHHLTRLCTTHRRADFRCPDSASIARRRQARRSKKRTNPFRSQRGRGRGPPARRTPASNPTNEAGSAQRSRASTSSSSTDTATTHSTSRRPGWPASA